MQAAEEYQSDQLGLWGELYLLFGYASLPLFFLVAFLFKRVYFAFRGPSPFVITVKRVVCLSIFVAVVNSFGMDWTLGQVIPLLAAVYIYRYFFAARRTGREIAPAPSGALAAQ
jgi:hypothetical protein